MTNDSTTTVPKWIKIYLWITFLNSLISKINPEVAFIKKNYGWLIVAILAILPMLAISNMVNIDLSDGLLISLVEENGKGGRTK